MSKHNFKVKYKFSNFVLKLFIQNMTLNRMHLHKNNFFQNTILAKNVILLKSFPSVHYILLSLATLAES